MTQVQINVSPLPLTDKVFSISCNTLYILESKGLCRNQGQRVWGVGDAMVWRRAAFIRQFSSAVPGDRTEGKATSADPQAHPWPWGSGEGLGSLPARRQGGEAGDSHPAEVRAQDIVTVLAVEEPLGLVFLSWHRESGIKTPLYSSNTSLLPKPPAPGRATAWLQGLGQVMAHHRKTAFPARFPPL